MGAYEEIKRAVSDVISSSGQYPFLFIGSGMSRRYLGSPDWVGLLRGVCADVFGATIPQEMYGITDEFRAWLSEPGNLSRLEERCG